MLRQFSAMAPPMARGKRTRYTSTMNAKIKIEVDSQVAELLEARATARGISVSELLADLAAGDRLLPPELNAMRERGDGPWAPEVLAEDERRVADFQRTRQGIPWDEIKAWMQTWGSPQELPPPKPRKL